MLCQNISLLFFYELQTRLGIILNTLMRLTGGNVGLCHFLGISFCRFTSELWTGLSAQRKLAFITHHAFVNILSH